MGRTPQGFRYQSGEPYREQVPTVPSGLSLVPLFSMMTNLGLWVATPTLGLVLPQEKIKSASC